MKCEFGTAVHLHGYLYAWNTFVSREVTNTATVKTRRSHLANVVQAWTPVCECKAVTKGINETPAYLIITTDSYKFPYNKTN
jgi:hypothetical protein